jgi:hypothetical protein
VELCSHTGRSRLSYRRAQDLFAAATGGCATRRSPIWPRRTSRCPADATYDRAILDVTMTHGLVPAQVYTSAVCGFAASMSRSRAREVSLDPRVESVQPDTIVTTG